MAKVGGYGKAYRIDEDALAAKRAVFAPKPSRTRRFFRRLKEVIQILLVCAVALAIALVVNTLRQSAQPLAAVAPPPADVVDAELVAHHLSDAVRVKTISHEDKALDDANEFQAMRALLERTYPKTHAALKHELIAGAGLLFTWKGTDDSLRPALFAAHMDVVPVEPGTEKEWTQPAFDGVVNGGFVWGRGATDDKGSLICLLEAAEALVTEGFHPKRTIYFAFGADEEVGGTVAKEIASTLKARNVLLEYVLDEGMAVTEGIFPDVAQPVAMIGTAEKGYLSVELTVTADGGHSSMPPSATATGRLAGAIDRLERSQMKARVAGAPRKAIESMAPYMPFKKRLVVSNLWLTEPLVAWLMGKSPASNALARTTTAPTIFESGVKENVLPSKARAVVNFRILPGDTVDGVMAHVRDVVADGRVQATKMERMVTEPSPESSADSRAYRLLETTIRQFFPDALVTPALVLGATDSRQYAGIAENVYRFVPIRFRADDLKRIHGTNERVEVNALGLEVRAYKQILRDGS